jgi:tetratricopeptide (TPR) repeat protein
MESSAADQKFQPSGGRAKVATRCRRAVQPRSLICLALLLATFAVFWPVRNYPFINYDDPEYVIRNNWVQQGLTLQGVVWAFTHIWAYNWHPVTWLSHMLDVSLFGSGPSGPHLINVLVHSSNAALLFLLLQRLTGALWPGALAAALFAWHPLHVESVAWISERKDVLSVFFGLLSLRSYVIYAQHSPKVQTLKPEIPEPVTLSETSAAEEEETNQSRQASRSRSGHYWLALAFYALSLMSKPMLASLPLLLLLLDYWPLRRRMELLPRHRALQRLVIEKLPFLGLSAASCLITVFVQARAGAVNTLVQMPMGARIGNAFVSCARYLAKVVWPAHLVLPYPHPGYWPLAQSCSAALLVGGLTWVAWSVRKRAPFALVGWLWFLITVLPVIGLVQVGTQAMADRYMYLPSIGLFVTFAWACRLAVEHGRIPPGVLASLAAAVLVGFAVRTRGQLHYWQNSEVLFHHTLACDRNNYGALVNHGGALEEQGRYDEALRDYQDALRIYPEAASVLYKMGTIYFYKRDDDMALRYYQQALQARPFADAHNGLGVIFKNQGRLDDAMAEYREALRLEPENAEAHNNVANLLVGQGRIDEAVRQYRLAVLDSPRYTVALDNLGWALAQQSHYAEAVACCRKAVSIKPEDPELRASFGDLLLRLGRNEEAKEQYGKAVELAPGSADAQLGLGRALNRLGERDKAVMHLKESLRLRPDNSDATKELEALMGSAGR